MFKFLDQNRVHRDISLKSFNSYKVGGNAKYLLYLHNDEVARVIEAISGIMPYVVLGMGCNVLVSDAGFDGVVIKLIDDNVRVDDDVVLNDDVLSTQLVGGCNASKSATCVIHADAGASLSKVAQVALKHGLSGLEWSCGLPSSVGGAVYGNAGARGFCVGDILKGCQVLYKNDIIYLNNTQCDFKYRHSVFMDCDKHSLFTNNGGLSINNDECSLFKNNDYTILSADFLLQRSSVAEVQSKMQAIQKLRNNPKGLSAGSVFKNGTDFVAGKLIDSCGLKGSRIGGASISTLHANFILNDGTATSKDIYELIKLVKQKVYEIHGVNFELEVRLIGEF